MAKKVELTDIPDNAVDVVVAGFKADGCSDIKKEKQQNGKWTVTATCPDD